MIKTTLIKLGLSILIFFLTFQISICQNVELHNIGYKSVVYIDYTRVNNSIDKELISKNSINNFRTITTSMWYPSTITKSDKMVNFGDFLPSIELDEKNDYNPKDSIAEPADKFADYYNIGKINLSKLLNYTTQSLLNPEYLSGKFPLVIYIPGMNGFSFENHILCEEIAKQGYVVISLNSKGCDGRWMAPNTFDYENQIRDVQFLIGETNKQTFIDNSNICLIGHSIGGYVNILTKIRDSRISSLVSLDGSIIHDLERSKNFVYNDLKEVNCELLSISTQDFNKAKIYLDSMVHADRYYYQTSSFKHQDFKSFTYIRQVDLDSTKYKKYQVLNSLIVSFINKVNHEKGDNNFNDLTKRLSEQGFAKTSYLPSTPDLSDFKSMAYQTDFSNLKSIYLNISKQYPEFSISKNDLYNWGNNFRFYGYLNHSIEVYKLLLDLYPDYISAFNGLARTLVLQNKYDRAIKVYESALKKFPNNESIKRKLNILKIEQSN